MLYNRHIYRESKHGGKMCAMYDLCGSRSDGKELNCPDPTPVVTVRPLIHLIKLLFNCCRITYSIGVVLHFLRLVCVNAYCCQCRESIFDISVLCKILLFSS